jgi:hypothetical protein
MIIVSCFWMHNNIPPFDSADFPTIVRYAQYLTAANAPVLLRDALELSMQTAATLAQVRRLGFRV